MRAIEAMAPTDSTISGSAMRLQQATGSPHSIGPVAGSQPSLSVKNSISTSASQKPGSMSMTMATKVSAWSNAPLPFDARIRRRRAQRHGDQRS